MTRLLTLIATAMAARALIREIRSAACIVCAATDDLPDLETWAARVVRGGAR